MKKRKQTSIPIKDGDARPDEEGVRSKPDPQLTKKKKFTEERGADTDSRDDYKDARELI